MNYKTTDVMGYDVLVDPLSSITIDPQKKQVINTINPHSYVTAKDDKLFEEALRASDTLLPDGSGIVMAAKYCNGEEIKKIAGNDLHAHLLQLLDEQGGSCFYMGSSNTTLDKIKERINRECPNIRAGFYSPPYKPQFSDEDNQAIVEAIEAFKPDVLFVGMTAPKQEKWLHENKDKVDFKIASSIGAVFDFYTGTIQRPSQFWINIHLEWLPRLLKEPKRLWRRNFVSTPLFVIDILLFKIGVKK